MNNPKRTVAVTVAFILAVVGIIAAFGLSGCTERAQVSHNLSQDADNFNVRRRVTVINMRSDKVLLQMEGCLSIKTDTETNELNVIAELPNGEYQKHFIYLNDWTMYTVEQIDSTKTDKYNYEFNFLPQELPGVKITSKDQSIGAPGTMLGAPLWRQNGTDSQALPFLRRRGVRPRCHHHRRHRGVRNQAPRRGHGLQGQLPDGGRPVSE